MDWQKIKTYEKACAVLGLNPKALPQTKGLSKDEAKDVITTLKVKRIIRALNYNPETKKVWEPNWHDTSQVKYNAWVEVQASAKRPGGFGFSCSFYDYWRSLTFVCSRLCLDSSEKVMHLHKHFKKLLIEYFLIIK